MLRILGYEHCFMLIVITAVHYSKTIGKVFGIQFDFLQALFDSYSIRSHKSLFAHP